MNIELSNMQKFSLAHVFAEEIHGVLVELHLRAIDRHDGKPTEELHSWRIEERRALRAAISSITPRWERRQFLGHLRYHFQKIRGERGTNPTSRAYVADVLRCRERRGA